MTNRIFLLVCFSLLTIGCATTRPFTYDHPTEVSKNDRGKIVAAIMPVKDKREDEKEIDKLYQNNPIKDIENIIKEELMCTGLFREVTILDDGVLNVEADILIEPSLTKMYWEVPGYKALLTKVFIVSYLTGGVGGIIYGITTTDVHGYTSIHVKMLEKSTGNMLLDKIYNGHAEEVRAKLKCDTPGTKTTIVGKSLKVAMEDLKSDLIEKLAEPKKEMTSSSVGQIMK